MVPAFVVRALLMVMGYVYPAYRCFKVVEQKRLEPAQLLFWCKYWMVLAVITAVEHLADPLVSWIPMYHEGKLALVVYLWYPTTQGTPYVYNTYMRPFLLRHEGTIDRHLAEAVTYSKEKASFCWRKACDLAQSCMADLVQLTESQQQRRAGGGGGRGDSGLGHNSNAAQRPGMAGRRRQADQLPPHPRIQEEESVYTEDDYEVVESDAEGEAPPGTQVPHQTGFFGGLRSRSGRSQ